MLELQKVKERGDQREKHVLLNNETQAEEPDSRKNQRESNADTHFHEEDGIYLAEKRTHPNIEKNTSQKIRTETIANWEYEKKNFRKAMEHYINGLEYAIRFQDKPAILNHHMQLALCCYYLNMISQALYHSEKMIQFINEAKGVVGSLKQKCYYIKSLIYYKQNDYLNLTQSMQKYVGLQQEPAEYDQEIELVQLHLASQLGQINIMALEKSLAYVLEENSRLSDLIDLFSVGRVQACSDGDINQMILLAKLFYRLNQTEKAAKLLKAAEKAIGSSEHINYQMDIYSLLGELAMGEGQAAAGQAYFKRLYQCI